MHVSPTSSRTTEFVFFGGKGGVGKTTCAAAHAIGAARRGRSVLVVSTDPAHSLGDALGTALGPEPRAVRAAPGLFGAELDADAALDRWLGERRTVLEAVLLRGTYLDGEDVERFLDLALPGVDELMAHMAHDKKVADGKLTFILVKGIGQAFITRDVPAQAVRDVLAA